MSNARVLFVDDEPNVLHAIRRSLRNDFEIAVAESGDEALRLLAEQLPFAAIVCDCRMPKMDGIELLRRVAHTAPNTVRLMLTGNIDQDTAVRAVNTGEVFRFLNKPCDVGELRIAVQAAVRQHELVIAERQLLEQTLHGSVGVLAEVLGLVKPETFGRTARLRRKAAAIAKHLDGISAWELDTAALLSQVGCMSVDQAILDKVHAGEALDGEDAERFARHAQLGADLIARIPRLERVAAIIRYQNKDFDGGGYPRDGLRRDAIPLEGRVLHGALVHDELHTRGWSDSAIVDVLRKKSGAVDPAVVEALARCVESPDETVSVLPGELALGMLLQQDVKTDQGTMLLCEGHEVTAAVLGHLRKFHRLGFLTQRLLVRRPGRARTDAVDGSGTARLVRQA
jgi:response regulator RpfG family c-di-GMP phosphodiesterase